MHLRVVLVSLLLGHMALGSSWHVPTEFSSNVETSTMMTGSSDDSDEEYGPIEYDDQYNYATLGPSNRTATLMIPGGHDYERPLPLVVSLHGYSSNGNWGASYLDLFDSVLHNEHLLLYPDGTMNPTALRFWNATPACCNYWDQEVDDVDWLIGMIDEAVSLYGADPDGIVFVGHSNGGFMSHRMACEQGNRIRGIVSFAGSTFDSFDENCADTGHPNILQVHGTFDLVIYYEGGYDHDPWDNEWNYYPGAESTVESWANRSGCDSDYTNMGELDLDTPAGVNDTDMLEHLNCVEGNRVALWRINEGSHAPAFVEGQFPNTTIPWALSGFIRDSDGDGVRDDEDVFQYDPNEWADSDGDGVGDNSDAFPDDPLETSDSDGDGVGDNSDALPDDPSEWADSDGDGVGDNSDAFPDDPLETSDSDGDGVGDNSDAFPMDASESSDSDGDGFGDNSDGFPMDASEWGDDDGDGVGNFADDFPMDANESSDFDGDGVGDNADAFPAVASEWRDADGDQVGDNVDAFPMDANETLDGDGDGVGDNSDSFPKNPTEWADSDGDGVGDNADAFPEDATETTDTDGDGVGDNLDAFPEDATETTDTDGDGVGDNLDGFPMDSNETTDSDGDGVGDNSDVFPHNPKESSDTDVDGVGDNLDSFPEDASEQHDSDGDSHGDNSDFYPLDADRWEEEGPMGFVLLIALSALILVALTRPMRR